MKRRKNHSRRAARRVDWLFSFLLKFLPVHISDNCISVFGANCVCSETERSSFLNVDVDSSEAGDLSLFAQLFATSYLGQLCFCLLGKSCVSGKRRVLFPKCFARFKQSRMAIFLFTQLSLRVHISDYCICLLSGQIICEE